MDKEKVFVFSLEQCPHCGMDGTLRLFQALGKPTRIACIFCNKPIYDIEIIETYFDVENMAENFLKKNERLQLEAKGKKELEEINRIKEKYALSQQGVKK